MKLPPCFKSVVVAASFAAFTVASSRAATVYSDDFTANPFTSAWTQTFPGGSYDLLWTGSANPNSWGGIAAGLPTNANSHSVYSFSDGKRTMSTVDTNVPAGVAGWTSMTYSLDFQMGGTGGVDNNEIGVLVNRSGANGYNAAIYTGGDGSILWYGGYGTISSGVLAASDTWYRFKTTVTKSGADISMQSQILDLSDNVLATSPFADYSAATYLDPNGFQISLGNYGGYWNHATQIDNFVVTAADSYWYWAPGAGGGGTGTWSAGGTNWAAGAGIQGSGTQSTNTTLLFGNTAGTVTVSNGVNVAAGMTFSTDGYTVTDSTITLTGANAASNTITTAASVGTTVASQLVGSNGMTKAGTGTLTFGGSAANTLTGTTTVSAGTLQLNKSASTTAIAGNLELANGATLLISQSEQVNNTSAVTLSGGTIIRGAGASEVFGSLNLTAASFLDFGTGATGSMTFGTYEENTTPSALLTVQNFLPGNSFTFSNALFAADGSNIGSYFSFGTGYINSSIIDNGGSSFTITAIPEPSTVLAALGLIGLLLWPARRRFMSTRHAGFWCCRP